MKCPLCKQEVEFCIGDVWVNGSGYRVRILDWGTVDIWLLYEENQNKCAWTIKTFLLKYHKEQILEE